MKKLHIALTILIILTANSMYISSPTAITSSSTVATSSVNLATLEAFQRKTFFANGRCWVFYSDGVNIGYKTSTDASTWNSSTYICPGGHGQAFSVWFDGTHIHYVKGPQGIGQMKYRRGEPNPDGTISWSAPEQIVLSFPTLYVYETYISVDSEGYPWIAYRWGTNGYRYPNCTRSSLNNGTWQTAPGFPYQLSSISTGPWICSIVPLTGRKMYAIYLPGGGIQGRLWNGAAWENEETITTLGIVRRFAHSVVARDDDIHLVFLTSRTYDIVYFKRTYGRGWGIQETLQTSQTSTSYPVLSFDTTTGSLYCFWGTSDIVYHKKRVDGKWDPTPTTWITEPNLIEETVTCFYQAGNAKIGVIWTQGNQTPYNVRFSHISLPVPYRKLNVRTYMNDLVTPLSSAQVIMNNGSDQVRKVDHNGWANFTEITTSSVTLKVKWQNSLVNGTFTVKMESDKTIIVRCNVYPISFVNSFRDDRGNPLYTNPSFFKLKCPNGTTTPSLPVRTHLLQEGSFTVKDVIWQGTDVTPTRAAFDPTNGNPTLNLKIHSTTLQIHKPDGSPFADAQLDIEFPNGTKTQNIQCDVTGMKILGQIQAGVCRLNVTTPNGFTAQTNFALETSAAQVNDVETTALKISQYNIDLSNAKVYVRLVFYNGTSVPNGSINYASSEASTNGTGWAMYTLTDLADVPYKSLAYGVRSPSGITYKWMNQTIPIAKTAQITLESDFTTIDHLAYDPATDTLTIVGTGVRTKTITMRCGKPTTLKIDGPAYEEGAKWTYNPARAILTIVDEWSNETSTKTITISWAKEARPIAINPYVLPAVAAVSMLLLLILMRRSGKKRYLSRGSMLADRPNVKPTGAKVHALRVRSSPTCRRSNVG